MEKSMLQTLRLLTAFGWLWLAYENMLYMPWFAALSLVIGIFAAWKYNFEMTKKED